MLNMLACFAKHVLESTKALFCDHASEGSGPKFFDPGWVGSIFCGSGQVGSAIYGLVLNLENFP